MPRHWLRSVAAIAMVIIVALLFVAQVANAALCLGSGQPATAQMFGDAGDDNCDEEGFPTTTLANSDFTKLPASPAHEAFDVLPLLDRGLLNEVTRGAPFKRDKTPLFLQTGRLRN